MKRTLLALLLAFIMIFTAACGQPASASGFTKNDVYLNIDGTQFRCNDNIQSVIEKLGTGYTYSDGLSCAYDGLDKIYSYASAEFFTNPLQDGDMVSEIYTEDPAVTTSRGITVGATKDEVLSAYGDGCDDTGNMLIYRADTQKEPRGSLCFELENDQVIAIFVTTESV